MLPSHQTSFFFQDTFLDSFLAPFHVRGDYVISPHQWRVSKQWRILSSGIAEGSKPGVLSPLLFLPLFVSNNVSHRDLYEMERIHIFE